MSTVFSTVLNFSILGLLRRLHRIDIQLELQATLEGVVKFPGIDRRTTKATKSLMSGESSLASIKDADIASAVDRARSKAKRALETLGMDKLLKVHSLWDKEYTMPAVSVDDNEVDDYDDTDESEVVDGPEVNNSPDSESSKLSALAETCLESPALIETDLKNMSSKQIVTTAAKEKLVHLHKALLPVDKLPSETIPLYKHKHGSHNSDILSEPVAGGKHVFTPYVQVQVKGRSVLIRKTTAVWLFQETERLSADRIFRVKLKQPFASVTSPQFRKENCVETSSEVSCDR